MPLLACPTPQVDPFKHSFTARCPIVRNWPSLTVEAAARSLLPNARVPLDSLIDAAGILTCSAHAIDSRFVQAFLLETPRGSATWWSLQPGEYQLRPPWNCRPAPAFADRLDHEADEAPRFGVAGPTKTA